MVEKAPNFVQIGCDFEENMVANAPTFCTFGCFKKKNTEIFFNPSNLSEIPLEDNTMIFFYSAYD